MITSLAVAGAFGDEFTDFLLRLTVMRFCSQLESLALARRAFEKQIGLNAASVAVHV